MIIHKKLVLILAVSAVLAFSCSDLKKSKNKNSKVNPVIKALIQKVKSTHTLPYKIDLNKVKITYSGEWKKKSNLNSNEVKLLVNKLMNYDLATKSRSKIENFLLVDSLKSNNLYEDYISKTEFPVVSAQANIGEKILINDSSFILLWAIYNEGIDGSGTSLYGTLFLNNIPQSTTVLGAYASGGEGEYLSEQITTSTITDSVITSISENIESYGNRKNKIYRNIYLINITYQGLLFVRSKKGKEKNS